MIGVSQYDMVHKMNYNDLQKRHNLLLKTNLPIVSNNTWSRGMVPNTRNLKFLLQHYNEHFNTKYKVSDLDGVTLSLFQTNIYPVKTFVKLGSWLEKLVDDIFPWCNLPPYESHFGSIGGYTERALGLFNAIEIVEGMKTVNLKIDHGAGAHYKEHYNKSSFLNQYTNNHFCKLLNELNINLKEVDDYCEVVHKSKKTKNSVVYDNVDNVTYFYLVSNEMKLTKPLMVVFDGTKHNFKRRFEYNIIHDNVSNNKFYYKVQPGNVVNLIINKDDIKEKAIVETNKLMNQLLMQKKITMGNKHELFSKYLVDKMIYNTLINQKVENGIIVEYGGEDGNDCNSISNFLKTSLDLKLY